MESFTGAFSGALCISICDKIQDIKKSEKDKTKQEYNQIFLNETGNIPTRKDSIYFFYNHGIDTNYVEEDIPLKKKKRIVNENKLEKDVKYK